MWPEVGYEDILNFLKTYEVPEICSAQFDVGLMVSALEKRHPKLVKWSVALMNVSGDRSKVNISGYEVNCAVRTAYNDNYSKNTILTFNNYRILSKGDTKEGLFQDGLYSIKWKKQLEDHWVEKSHTEPTDQTYLNDAERLPLLLIYPFDFIGNSRPDTDLKKYIKSVLSDITLFGIAMAFPVDTKDVYFLPSFKVSKSKGSMYVDYVSNVIYARNGGNPLLDLPEYDEDTVEADEDDE